MNIAFWLTSGTRFMNYDNWGKAPMGGAEISAVHLGEELRKLGHKTTYYLGNIDPEIKKPEQDGLVIKRWNMIYNDELEYFICVRPHPVLQGDFGDAKKLLWSGDAFDQSSNDIFFDKRVADSMYGYVFKTDWQRKKVLEKYYTIPPEKASVIYNGYKSEWFNSDGNKPDPKRFIHTSTYYRGVKNFIDIWPEILKNIPDAELHVFSKTSLYSPMAHSEGWAELAEQLIQIPGIIVREPVPQWILAKEMKKAWLMLYPNTGFVESSCGSAIQAIASGVPVIATKRAGLIETVGRAGVLIDSNEEGWKENFVKAVVEMDSKKRKEIADYGFQKMLNQTWKHQAKEWEDYLKSL